METLHSFCALLAQRSRKANCPVTGCPQKLRLERDIKVDDALRDALRGAPMNVDEVEVRRTQRGAFLLRTIAVEGSAPVEVDKERVRAAGSKRKAAVNATGAIMRAPASKQMKKEV